MNKAKNLPQLLVFPIIRKPMPQPLHAAVFACPDYFGVS
jgi:hypothetical protein